MDNKQTREEKVFICRHCGNKTSHALVYTHSVDVPLGIYDENYDEITSPDYFFLFECKTCHGISLKNVFSEQLDPDPTAEIPFESVEYLYPSVKTFEEEVPAGLRLVMSEASKVKLISAMAYLILVRKILEELCKERGIKEKNLQENLKKLVENEKLPDIFVKSSDKLRLLGNIGAHESKIEINKEDIKLVEEFLFALVEYIYVMPFKLDKLNEAFDKQKTKDKEVKKTNVKK